MNFTSSLNSDSCQICQTLDPEDICIIQEMLTNVFKSHLENQQKISNAILSFIFKHLKFRKSLAQIFDSKYIEVNDKCNHQKLQQVFMGLWQNHQGQDKCDKLFYIEDGLEELNDLDNQKNSLINQQFNYLIVMKIVLQIKIKWKVRRKQRKKKVVIQNLQYFDLILEKEDIENNSGGGMMKFNKNSNKNKFQKRSIDLLKKWFLDHLDNPYPDQNEKNRLSSQTGMHVRQIQNWFTNSRKRYLEPLKKKFELNGQFDQRLSLSGLDNCGLADDDDDYEAAAAENEEIKDEKIKKVKVEEPQQEVQQQKKPQNKQEQQPQLKQEQQQEQDIQKEQDLKQPIKQDKQQQQQQQQLPQQQPLPQQQMQFSQAIPQMIPQPMSMPQLPQGYPFQQQQLMNQQYSQYYQPQLQQQQYFQMLEWQRIQSMHLYSMMQQQMPQNIQNMPQPMQQPMPYGYMPPPFFPPYMMPPQQPAQQPKPDQSQK